MRVEGLELMVVILSGRQDCTAHEFRWFGMEGLGARV